MRPRRALLVILAAFCAASCGSSGTTEPAPAAGTGGGGGGGGGTGNRITVTVSNNAYTPDQVSIAKGATVTWQWDSCTGDGYGGQECAFHTVTFDDGGSSATARNEGTFARTFANAGTYTYYCTAHGRSVMSGAVAVQ